MNDGGWHEVKAQFNPSYLEVTVDGRKKSHRPELRDNRHIDLSGLLYFGGIEATKRSRAVSQGVTAAQAAPVGELGGLRGCLSHLELDGRRIGLPEVLETNSIQAGCQWQYPCKISKKSHHFHFPHLQIHMLGLVHCSYCLGKSPFSLRNRGGTDFCYLFKAKTSHA